MGKAGISLRIEIRWKSMSALNKYGEIEDGGCRHCGNPIKPDWVACPECGELLESPKPEPIMVRELEKRGIQTVSRQVNSRPTLSEDLRLRVLADYHELSDLKRFRQRFSSVAGESRVAAWRQAASLGMPEAQFLLACCCFLGRGMVQSDSETVRWLQKAAEGGVPNAQFFLAVCYGNGFGGLPVDKMEADRWTERSSEATCKLSVGGAEWDQWLEGAKLVEDLVFKKQKGNCFITTASARSLGLNDDCHELNLLRSFRDSYMRATPRRWQQVQQYYSIAPGVVRQIELNSDSAAIWRELWFSHIQPAVAAIERRSPQEAHERYAAMMREVCWQYLSPFSAKHHHE
jgi:hypothetical protein